MEKLQNALTEVGLPAEFLSRKAAALSGGQAQRVAIAKALLLNHSLLILDEVTSALDVSVQAQVLNLLMEIQTSKQLAMIFVSHDLAVVNHISNELLVMSDGEIVEQGLTEEIVRNPQHVYTQQLLTARTQSRIGIAIDNIARQQSKGPTLVGVLLRFHEQEQVGAYSPLPIALQVAIAKLGVENSFCRLQKIRQKRDTILKLLAEHNATELRIFGSVARSEDSAESDVDLIANFDRGYDMLRNRVPLTLELTSLLGCEIDLIPEHEINPQMRDTILSEALPL